MSMNLPIIVQYISAGSTSISVPAIVPPAGRIVRVSVDGVNVPFRWTGVTGLSLYNAPRLGSLVSVFLDDMTSSDTIQGAANLDFPSIAAGGVADLTMTFPGILNTLLAVYPVWTAAPPTGIVLSAWVTGAGTVTIRAYNPTTAAIDPVSAAVRVVVVPG